MNHEPRRAWTAAELQSLSRSYQGAAILSAAAELNIFDALAPGPMTATDLAERLACDTRGLVILLDALTALDLLCKHQDRYKLSDGVGSFLIESGPESILAITQHHANCLRNWAQLARVIKTGRPAKRTPSIRGEAGDQSAFIGGMDNLGAPVAARIIEAIQPMQFEHLLDIGGASGTWTIAFLSACPEASATLVDLPSVIPLAGQRLAGAGLAARVRLVVGDFMRDDLPGGADLAWLSAIVHQNSRMQNRALFAKVYGALQPGGRLAIRDVLMEEGRVRPVAGALFAVNMLVATEGGGTFTAGELREDLEAAGFTGFSVVRRDEGMHGIVVAVRPG
jgi:SAM-dependent methyltransferase